MDYNHNISVLETLKYIITINILIPILYIIINDTYSNLE